MNNALLISIFRARHALSKIEIKTSRQESERERDASLRSCLRGLRGRPESDAGVMFSTSSLSPDILRPTPLFNTISAAVFKCVC
jgi:hypothetical protein